MAQICLAKTFSATPDLGGTDIVLDEWLPLDLTALTSATVTLIGEEDFVRAILDEHGDALIGEGGGAILEE